MKLGPSNIDPRTNRRTDMDALSLAAAAFAIVAGLAAFDWLAGRYGTDSRDRIGDDRRRPAGI